MQLSKEEAKHIFAPLPEALRRIDKIKGDIVYFDLLSAQSYKTQKQNNLFHSLLQCFWESGCSPDGFILNRTSGIEIKCPQDNTYARYLYDGKIKPEYYAQMQMQMMLTDCQYWYYVVFNPNFDNSIVIRKVEADKDFQQKLRTGIDKGKQLINEITSKIDEHTQQIHDDDDFWNDFTPTIDYRI